MEKKLNVLDKPLSAEEIRARLKDDSTYITGVVRIRLSFVIDNDLDGLLDQLSEELVGDLFLMDITYKVVGVGDDGDTLFIEVSGDVTEILDDEDEEAEEGEWCLTVKELCHDYPSLYDYDYKWTDSKNYRRLSEVLEVLGYRLKDDSIEGEYNDIKGYYNCQVAKIQ